MTASLKAVLVRMKSGLEGDRESSRRMAIAVHLLAEYIDKQCRCGKLTGASCQPCRLLQRVEAALNGEED